MHLDNRFFTRDDQLDKLYKLDYCESDSNKNIKKKINKDNPRNIVAKYIKYLSPILFTIGYFSGIYVLGVIFFMLIVSFYIDKRHDDYRSFVSGRYKDLNIYNNVVVREVIKPNDYNDSDWHNFISNLYKTKISKPVINYSKYGIKFTFFNVDTWDNSALEQCKKFEKGAVSMNILLDNRNTVSNNDSFILNNKESYLIESFKKKSSGLNEDDKQNIHSIYMHKSNIDNAFKNINENYGRLTVKDQQDFDELIQSLFSGSATWHNIIRSVDSKDENYIAATTQYKELCEIVGNKLLDLSDKLNKDLIFDLEKQNIYLKDKYSV